MNLASPSEIKSLLQQYDAKPSKLMGQNFLIDRNVLEKIVESAQLIKEDVVLEVGPGIGILTNKLAEKAGKVIAVEKDRKMLEILKETLKQYDNIKLIQADILKIENPDLPASNYKVVANIPYYLTAALIRKFLERENQPAAMSLMIQKEVAQRICAKPPKMSLLAVAVQFYADPKIVSYVGKESFWPVPKVDSAIIKIENIKKPITDEKKFFKVVKAGFSQPRKQLLNNFSNQLKKDRSEVSQILSANNIKPTQRAGTLNLQDWVKLTNSF